MVSRTSSLDSPEDTERSFPEVVIKTRLVTLGKPSGQKHIDVLIV